MEEAKLIDAPLDKIKPIKFTKTIPNTASAGDGYLSLKVPNKYKYVLGIELYEISVSDPYYIGFKPDESQVLYNPLPPGFFKKRDHEITFRPVRKGDWPVEGQSSQVYYNVPSSPGSDIELAIVLWVIEGKDCDEHEKE